MNEQPLTSSSVFGEIEEILKKGGYSPVNIEGSEYWSSRNSRLYEDRFGVVAVAFFQTWDQLSNEWEHAQSHLVDVISDHISRGEPKAWDGYLVLLTTSPVRRQAEVHQIRYDTTRVRKLVATGEELEALSDIRSLLSPLLPVESDPFSEQTGDVLDQLPALLDKKGIPQTKSMELIRAFRTGASLMDALRKEG